MSQRDSFSSVVNKKQPVWVLSKARGSNKSQRANSHLKKKKNFPLWYSFILSLFHTDETRTHTHTHTHILVGVCHWSNASPCPLTITSTYNHHPNAKNKSQPSHRLSNLWGSPFFGPHECSKTSQYKLMMSQLKCTILYLKHNVFLCLTFLW